MIVGPKNQREIFENLKYVVDHDLILQDSFYDEATLKNIFGLDSIDCTDEVIDGDRKILILSNAFSTLFQKIYGSGYVNANINANLTGGKTTSKNGQIDAGINFYMSSGGPSFPETQFMFENKLVKLDPQFPGMYGRPQSARVPHGNETWRQRWTSNNLEKVLTLGFNNDAELARVIIEIYKNK